MTRKQSADRSPSTRRSFVGRSLASASAAMLAGGFLASDEGQGREIAEGSAVPASDRCIVLASETGAKLDSNVETGGGTDDTEILQAVLDKAVEWGTLHLIMDGAALTAGLRVHSNTTIQCLNQSCGFFQKANTNKPVLINARPRIAGERLDKNILLIGGTYNHNSREQAHHYEVDGTDRDNVPWAWASENTRFNITLEFFGVENFTMRDVTIRDQRTFALLMGNFFRATFENIYIDRPNGKDGENQDGLHFWGPGRFLVIKNIQGDAGDDFLALAPDEYDLESDITDVLIDGVMLHDADQGIRLLSRNTGRLDRVVIRNVTGTYRSFGFYIEPWFNKTGGNYGSIIFDTVDLRPLEPIYPYRLPVLFSVGGTIENLILRNISNHQPSDGRVLFDFGAASCKHGLGEHGDIPHMNIKSALIDGLRIYEDSDKAADAAHILIHGPVGSLVVRRVDVLRNDSVPVGGALIETREDAAVGTLLVDGVFAQRLGRVISHKAGAINTLRLQHVIANPTSDAPVTVESGRIGRLLTHCVTGAQPVAIVGDGEVGSQEDV
jgi:hypothetical protein